jgi:predicted phosphoribosyltransferase
MGAADRKEAARARRAARHGAEVTRWYSPYLGGVPMARVIADALGGELDVVLVHKQVRRAIPSTPSVRWRKAAT